MGSAANARRSRLAIVPAPSSPGPAGPSGAPRRRGSSMRHTSADRGEAERAEQEEARTPPEARHDPPRGGEAAGEADRDPGVVHARREPEAGGREAVAQHRDGGGRQRRLAHAHEPAPEDERREARGGAGEGGRGAPRREAARDDPGPPPAVGRGAQDQRAEGEDHDERRPDEEADVGPRQPQLGHQHRRERRHELAVDVAEDVERGEGEEQPPGAALGHPGYFFGADLACAWASSNDRGTFSVTVQPRAAISFFATADIVPVMRSSSFVAPSSALARFSTSVSALS